MTQFSKVYQYSGYEPVWDSPLHMQDLQWDWRRTCSVSINSLTCFENMKDWEKIHEESGVSPSSLKSSEGLRDSQTFRTFSLMSYLQGWRAKSCGKWAELSSLTLIPPSFLWNLASRSKRAAKSRKTASPSSLFMETGLSLEREDAKLSHTQGSRSLKRTGLCHCWFRLSTKCEQSRPVDLSLTGRGEHPVPALPNPCPPGLLA